MNKFERNVHKIFENLGVEVENIEMTIRHFKIHAKKGENKHMFVKACSPSDHRADLNFKTDVKRWLRSIQEI